MSRSLICTNDLGTGFCYNSVSGKIDVNSSSAWCPQRREDINGPIPGGAHQLMYTPTTELQVLVYKNGVLQREGAANDYVYSTIPGIITPNIPIVSGEYLTVTYYGCDVHIPL